MDEGQDDLADIELGQYYKISSLAQQDNFIRFRESQLFLDSKEEENKYFDQ